MDQGLSFLSKHHPLEIDIPARMRVPASLVNDVGIGRDRRFGIIDNFRTAGRFRRPKLRVLVMGAAADVGHACARAFADHGAELFLSDLDAPGLERASAEFGATGLPCDVSSEASVAKFAKQVEQAVTSLDVLVNAAGRSYVRTLGTLRVSRALMPMMVKDGGPKDIVNIADMKVGMDCGPFPYAASISAFQALADAMAQNMRYSNLMLTTVLPLSEKADRKPASEPPLSPESWHRRLYCDHRKTDAIAHAILSSGDRFAPDRRSRHPDSVRHNLSGRA